MRFCLMISVLKTWSASLRKTGRHENRLFDCIGVFEVLRLISHTHLTLVQGQLRAHGLTSEGCSRTKQRAISVQPAPGKPTVSQKPNINIHSFGGCICILLTFTHFAWSANTARYRGFESLSLRKNYDLVQAERSALRFDALWTIQEIHNACGSTWCWIWIHNHIREC